MTNKANMPHNRNMQWTNQQKVGMVRQARKRLRMKQYDFAELMGVSTATICQWEAMACSACRKRVNLTGENAYHHKDGTSLCRGGKPEGLRVPLGANFRLFMIICDQRGVKFDENGVLLDRLTLDSQAKKRKVA